MKTKSPLFRIDRLLIAVLALIAVPQANAQTVRTWANTGASTAWYTAGNWNPSTASSAWATNDTALFQNAGSATTAGINMGTASLSISAIHVDSTRSRALTIGNSSGTVGTLTLNGTTVNSISNVVLRNASANLLTLQNNETSTGKTMNIALGNSTNNIISVDGTGGITISSVIQGAGRNLTISGTNTGTVTLSGANTFSGTLTTSATTTSVSGTQSVTNVVVDGGTLNLGAADRFLNTAAVSISSGTLGMSAFNDTVGSFLISGGTLAGSGTLTASTYALQGGTLTANLGAGAATVTTGTTALNGALAASTVDVASGTLTAGSAGRFTGTPTVTVSNGATLNLAGNETFGSLAGTGSVSNSAGRITAGGNNSSTTFGGVLSGAGELTKTGSGTLTLSGNNTFGGVLTVAEGKLTVSSVNNASQNGVLGNSANAVVLGASGQTGFLHYVGNTNASTDKTFTAATGGTAGIEASNAATTLTLSGAIGGAGNVQKGGAGTLLLAGNNTFTGALNVHDGTLEIASINNNSANGPLGNSTNPVSLGKSGTANVSTLHYTGGTASTTKGFSMASDATAGVINVANSGTTLTVSGQITGSSGSGLTKTGIGRLSLSGSSSYNGATAVSAGELNLSGGSIANSAVTVASGASLSGYGSVGTIGGAGAINPGNSPGILTTPQVNPSGGTDFNFEMTGTAPNYSDAASSVNDLIQITGGTPFSQALAAGNGINIYFSGDALFTGSTAVQYKGGFFTDQSASFASSISSATYNYYFANASGTNSYNGVNYYSKAQYETAVLSSNLMTITVTTVAQTANFGGGDINGQIMQVQVVPEPSTYALLGLSAAAFGAYRWRRRRRG